MSLYKDVDHWIAKYNNLEEENRGLRLKIDALQSKIDRLILEYCPSEMSEAQLAEWAARQKVSKGE